MLRADFEQTSRQYEQSGHIDWSPAPAPYRPYLPAAVITLGLLAAVILLLFSGDAHGGTPNGFIVG